MLNHQLAGARLAAILALVLATACAETDQPEPQSGLLTDYASGVDAAFGVEAFALGETLAVVFPVANWEVVDNVPPPSLEVTFKVTGYQIGVGKGYIQCQLNGGTPFKFPTLKYTLTDLGKPGIKRLACVLTDGNGVIIKQATAKTIYTFSLVKKCNLNGDCDDGIKCSDDGCENSQCRYKWKPDCCESASDCDNIVKGETCDTSGPLGKCSSCTADIDCDDGVSCTVDKCDTSGVKGKCTNIKPAGVCCKTADDPTGSKGCDDGKPCTQDACNLATGKCSNTMLPDACCLNSDCSSPDVCHEAVCVDWECRVQPDKFKPDCCMGDGDCSDNQYCTIDKCTTPKETAGVKWTQCTHVQDPAKPNCCDVNQPTACDDKNTCTWDICENYQCKHVEIGECCVTDKDCLAANNDICTDKPKVKCTIPPGGGAGKCSFPKIADCCTDGPDCNDGKYCTNDSCNLLTNKCKHVQKFPGCCDEVSQCDDGKFCTAANCVNHDCFFGPDKFKPGCCEQNVECNDGNPCTVDTCDTANKKCKFVNGGDPSCCNKPADCDDGDCSTLDFCGISNTCSHKKDVTKCASNVDCDDGNPCTIDACDTSGQCGLCTHKKDPKCCLDDFECNDSNACTADKCTNNKCESSAISNCCIDDKDAVTACDDNNECTIDYCLNNQCRHTAPKNGCCASKSDCYDGWACTTDTCTDIDPVTKKGTCSYILQDGCKCTKASDCNDNNVCTADSCVGGKCVQTAIKSCCLDQFDCNDGSPCTLDQCVFNQCLNYEPTGSGQKLCCTVKTEASDCAYLNSECAKGVCAQQPDGTRKCVTKPMDICTVNIGYCQDFSTQPTLKGNGWNPGDVKAGASKNWSVATNGQLGPDAHASFTWTPTHSNFDTCLQSPVIQAAGAKKITMQYDEFFDINKPGVSLRVLGSLDGANVDWTKATMIDAKITPAADIGPVTVDLTLPPNLTGSNGLRIAFCLSGATTFDLTSFQLDNICVVKGAKPYFPSCPPNQIVPHGKTRSIPIKAKDPDANAILSFSIEKGPSFVYLSSAMYFWLDASWRTTLTATPTSLNDVGTHEVTIKVSDGFLYSLCTFQITVTYEGGYLVWRPSEVPEVAGTAIFNALKKQTNGKVVQHLTDLALYPDLSGFVADGAIFVTLGVYPDNHVLTESEVGSLKLFLQNGGKLYMEGGDTWAFDKATSLHPMFQVKPQGDTSLGGVTGPLKGDHIYRNINASPVKKYAWEYDQAFAWNNVNDQLLANAAVSDTRDVLLSQGQAEKFYTQVAHDNGAGYRTVASSVLFGGLKAGVTNDNPNAMIGKILEFFVNGFIDCKTDAQCDDGSACTVDKCAGNKCSHTNTCQCTAAGVGACGATIKLATTDGKATDKVDAYSCGGGVVYSGSEHAYQFETNASKPVTLEVTSLSNPNARIIVVRDDGTGCNPDACIAIGDKSKAINFAGAKGAKYYLILDTPNNEAASADVKISCGVAEICDDGKDNNANGLIDCKDLASCCGDAACAEVCDDVDNDCDGKTDEACDKDGDKYCDAAMVTDGTPATCPKGGKDCNDDDSTVNPGNKEICLNGKDDNCDGNKDENGAAGCKNIYQDLDGDTYGAGQSLCMCEPKVTGGFTAFKGGDCNDSDKAVNPGATEICNNNIDDDCTGSQNDQNALGCKDFYTDVDQDGWGTLPKKCLCFGAGTITATQPGDCDDNNAAINPALLETCNNKDDNCDGQIDEGCDDDKDGYCDVDLKYEAIGANTAICSTASQTANLLLECQTGSTITNVLFASYGTPTGTCANDDLAVSNCHAAVSLQLLKAKCLGKSSCIVAATDAVFGGDPCPNQNVQMVLKVKAVCTGSGGKAPDICPKGAGDSDDLDPTINPAGKEICDGKDNNSDGLVDEGCDDDGDDFCDVDMIVVGAPAVCPKGKGDCMDTKSFVNPGAPENCATPEDDNCNGTNNDLDAENCAPHFYDNDKDGYGTKDFKCICTPIGSFTAKKTADCDDYNPLKNPGMAEICDNIDNDCDGVVDNGCDDDGDGFCDASLKFGAGGSTVCPNGKGDCDDTNKAINPSVLEVCGDGVDNNCDGSQNDPGAKGCVKYYADADGDTYGTTSSKCICQPEGSFKATNPNDCDDSNKAINPAAAEICDDLDNNCSGGYDEGCDDDNDGFCDDQMVTKGTPKSCPKGGGDCNDNAPNVNPGLAKEACDNIDDNCNGVVDDGCDKDNDGYCDAQASVINPPPAVCAKGPGDCNDFNNDQNPGHAEVCGNGIDDNCDGSQNDVGAINCKTFYFDGDGDKFGLNLSKCLCAPTGSYQATSAGDCNDSVAAINPAAKEICGDSQDNDCDGSQNDENAQGCTKFYYDGDLDGYGLSGLSKCLCVGAGEYVAAKGGDCNDLVKAVNPGAAEVCDDIDNNCSTKVDEGCNDDGDGFCDIKMTTIGLPNACPFGGGDCDDTKAAVNPGHTEICDGLDNNCKGNTDEGCDDDDDDFCDADMQTVGTPPTCSGGGGDCDDLNVKVNPGKKEDCATPVDDDCTGTTNDKDALGCKVFGEDADGDTYWDNTKPTSCLCVAEGLLTGTTKGDCNDHNKLVNPGVTEICDGVDNDCDGAVDEGCDNDGDDYCDSGIATIGKPSICPKGGGDCNDNDASINPGAKEVCNNNVDDNCDGSQNDVGATGCTKFWYDADADGWAVQLAQCLCKPAGGYTQPDASKLGDCDDTEPKTNPAAPEVCGDGLDNNCNGTQNDPNAQGCKSFYADGDKDGYGAGTPTCRCVAEGKYVTALGGDCNDSDVEVNPGLAEMCDGKDNNCKLGADEGCDDDGDGFCDLTMKVVGSPASCPSGGGDCDDTNAQVNPKKAEQCDNKDQDCDGVVDNGCDDDLDGYCDKTMVISSLFKPDICPKGGGDCNDGNKNVNPGKVELCDDADNNCNGLFDEGCDKDSDGYCTTAMSIIGTPKVCPKGGGDCDDVKPQVNPGAKEICDGLDNNCAGGKDEICNDLDGDGYCLGFAVKSPGCPNGGGDCDDGNKLVNPGATEDCATADDDDCNGKINEIDALNCKNWYIDADNDGFGKLGSTPTCACSQTGKYTSPNDKDCVDTNSKSKPGAIEICDGIDNNCNDPSTAKPTFVGNVISMNTRSHGGGYHPYYKQYWYPSWSGQTIYRYDQSYTQLGTFNSGQNCMMQLWADTDGKSTDYYTANWGYNTITRRKALSSGTVWTYNLGSTAGGVATDAKYAYGMRANGATVWVINKTNGQLVKTMNLSGGTVGSLNGGLAIHKSWLWYGHTNATVSRFDLATMKYDGMQFNSQVNIYNMVYTGARYCVSANNSSVYCYKMNMPTVDEGCDDDLDGYCDNTMLLLPGATKPRPDGSAATCPHSAMACDGIVADNRCYRAFDGQKTWKQAEVSCQEWGGKLASIHNVSAQTQVTAEAKKICGATQPCDGTVYKGKCIKGVKSVAKVWDAAETDCNAWGGTLVSIHDGAENAVAHAEAKKACGTAGPYFIGLNDKGSAGKYVWTDGTATSYKNWDASQPDNKSFANEKVVSGTYNQVKTAVYNGSGATMLLSFTGVPPGATADLKVTINVWGDYNSSSERGNVYVDEKYIGYGGGKGASCSYGAGTTTVLTAPKALADDGKLLVRVINTSSVGTCGLHKVEVRIQYSYLKVANGEATVSEAAPQTGKWNDVSPTIKRSCMVCQRPTTKGYWIGFNDQKIDGNFVWSDSTPVNYKNWAKGEPNDITLNGTPFPGSKLISAGQGLQINAWLGKPDQRWALCYSKTTHGGSSYDFHNRCNNRGPTVSIFKTNFNNNNNLFGGYASVSWSSANNYRNDPNAFLFSLTKGSKHAVKIPQNALYDTGSYGPTFGGGHDIYTDNSGSYQYHNFGHTYQCPYGSGGSCQSYFMGTYSGNYLVDYEVWYQSGTGGGVADTPGAGQDYAKVSLATGLWSDHENVDGGGCFVCSRPMTTSQFGKGDDCDDDDVTLHPGNNEVCDGVDNNCNGIPDEGCDDDGDGYCDIGLGVVGTPSSCPKGVGDCDDTNNTVNPAAQENCTTPMDDNCDGSYSDLNALGCTKMYYDNDGDGYGTSSFRCICPVTACRRGLLVERFNTVESKGVCTDDKTKSCVADNNCIAGKCVGYQPAEMKGWTTQTCAAGNYDEPTGCKPNTGTKGFVHWPEAALSRSLKGVLYYGDPANLNYNFGPSAGTATSPKIKIPASAKPTLEVSIYLGTEDSKTKDLLYLNVLQNGVKVKTLWSKKNPPQAVFKGTQLLNAANVKTLNNWAGTPGQVWKLCYSKALNGASSYTFHSRCDNKGPTYTVIRSTLGRVYGGYYGQSWTSAGNYRYHNGSFIYSLTSGVKYGQNRPQYAVYDRNSYGPTFGNGHDIYIDNGMTYGYHNFGYGYKCPWCNNCSNSTCRNHLAGTYSGNIIKDVEVFYKDSGTAYSVDTWSDLQFDLTEFLGKEVQFQFYFQTVDGTNNTGKGVFIDDFKVLDGTCDKYQASNTGDCNDSNPLVYPSEAAEICDGLDNDCDGTVDDGCDADKDGFCTSAKPVISTVSCPKTGTIATKNCKVSYVDSPKFIGHVISMNTRSHGGGYQPFYKEYWYPQWSGTTVYRYDSKYQQLGSFSSGQNCMMQLWADSDGKSSDYYTANWGYNTISKIKGKSSAKYWNYNIGSTAAAVTTDANYVYAMRHSGNRVYVLNKSNGSYVKSVYLSGGYQNSMYGSLVAVNGKLWRGNYNRSAYRFNLSNGQWDGGTFNTAPYIYSMAFNGKDYCVSENNSSVYCYSLLWGSCSAGDDCDDTTASVQPGAVEICDDADNNCDGKADEGCDEDGDGYCNAKKPVIGAPKVCPKGGGDCDDTAKITNPGTKETCDGKDNNCNSLIDEGSAYGCVNWYFDGDQDGYGLSSNAQCLCKASDLYTTKLAGDCNDNCPECYPGAPEICDGKLNSCGKIGAAGLKVLKDKIAAQEKVVTAAAAAVASAKTALANAEADVTKKQAAFVAADKALQAALNSGGNNAATINAAKAKYAAAAKDLQGAFLARDVAKEKVAAAEATLVNEKAVLADLKSQLQILIDGKGGIVDYGCDKDGDGYCDKTKLTIGTPAVCPKGGNDCNDTNKSINPAGAELCNNIDENCNGITDEGAVTDDCLKGAPKNATMACVKGKCAVYGCKPSFFDLNGLSSDGCECNGNDAHEPNESCDVSTKLVSSLVDKGETILVSGKLVASPDVDWYKFYATDQADSGNGVCDRFNVRVRFLKNPGGLAFEVHRGSCPSPKSAVCCGETDFNWFTNFKGYKNNVYSSYHSEWGECPCTTSNDYWSTQLGYNQPPSQNGPYCKKWSNGVCIPRGYDYTKCTDDSNWFYIKVYKKSGAPACSDYRLEITNGVYGSTGHKGYYVGAYSGSGISTIGQSQSNPGTSCMQIKTMNPGAPTGNYWIKPGAPTIQVWCDMTTEGGGYTFYPISSGKVTRRWTDSNSCKDLGMDIVYPRSKAHWTAMLNKYGSSYFQVIPGVYKPSSGGNYTGCKMRSPTHYGNGCGGWRVPDGGRWWMRDSNYSEPNGDYSANCWLLQYDWNVNNIRYNDHWCNYSTNRYICSTNDKP